MHKFWSDFKSNTSISKTPLKYKDWLLKYSSTIWTKQGQEKAQGFNFNLIKHETPA